MADDGEPNDGAGFGIAFDLDDDAVPKKPAAPPSSPQRGPGMPPGMGPQHPAGLAPPTYGPPGEARLPQGMGPQFPPQARGPMGPPGPGMGPYQGPPGMGPYPGAQNDPGFVPVDVPPSRTFGDQAADVARIAAERGKVVAEKTRDAAIVVAGKTREAAMKAAVQSIGGEAKEKVIRIEDPSTWLKPMRGPLIALGLAIFVSIVAVIIGKATGTKLAVGWISGPLLLGAIVFAVIRWIRLQE